MSGGGDDKSAKKSEYFQKLIALIEEYPKIVVIGADNVGSSQMQKIRQQLRGQGVVLMGKNTMIRKAIRMHLEHKPDLETLLPYVRGNMGFIFTKGDLNYVKQRLVENRVGAPAKAGSLAPNDVFVRAGPTGMEPTQTTFLQALNIASKINKGQIEIISDVHLIKAGDKVGQSEATLLAKLNIKPFSYGMTIISVYDNGFIYDPKVLELTDDDILDRFRAGVSNIAQLSLEIGYPTLASLPHSIAGAFKNVVAVALETDVLFPAAQKFKDYLANPGAFASAAPAAASSSKAASAPAAAPAKKEEPKVEEEDEDMGLGLFD